MNRGFTLAEVLITLGVIGVIAALTMPTVIRNFKVKQTVTQLKKDYSLISNAVLMAKNENDGLENWGLTGDNEESATLLADKLKPYFKVIKDCGTEKGEECVYQDNFYMLNGSKEDTNDYKFFEKKYYKLLIANGSSVILRGKTECSLLSTKQCAEIYVDINNKKSPNMLGKDIFYFMVYQNGQVIPAIIGIDPNDGTNKHRCNPKAATAGWSCTAWVIYNENMDYLYCADKLSWNGKKSCK